MEIWIRRAVRVDQSGGRIGCGDAGAGHRARCGRRGQGGARGLGKAGLARPAGPQAGSAVAPLRRTDRSERRDAGPDADTRQRQDDCRKPCAVGLGGRHVPLLRGSVRNIGIGGDSGARRLFLLQFIRAGRCGGRDHAMEFTDHAGSAKTCAGARRRQYDCSQVVGSDAVRRSSVRAHCARGRIAARGGQRGHRLRRVGGTQHGRASRRRHDHLHWRHGQRARNRQGCRRTPDTGDAGAGRQIAEYRFRRRRYRSRDHRHAVRDFPQCGPVLHRGFPHPGPGGNLRPLRCASGRSDQSAQGRFALCRRYRGRASVKFSSPR